MTPMITIGMGVVLLGDPFGPRMMIGSALAIIGVLVIALRRNQIMAMLMAVRSRLI